MESIKLVFATNNKHKLSEVRRLLKGKRFELLSLRDIGFEEDIPEPFKTLEANALQKARVIHKKYGLNCFSEDTGLEVTALNGEPGVKTARYAGPQRSAEANMDLVLYKLQEESDRSAQFRTVIALIINEKEYLFEGIVKGEIFTEKQGDNGFGYDPIFRPEGHSRTFAEMSSEEKNKISHRGLAVQKLIDFLDNIKEN